MNKELKALIQNEREMGFLTRRECYGYIYTKCLRKCQWYAAHHNKIRFLLTRLRLHHLSEKYGFQISYATKIGRGLYLGHMGTIIINWKAVLGNNVNLAQGVTVGMVNGGKRDGVPKIGNNVWIGANATVAGGITIGDDVMIAPNTFVNFDVPAHSLVIMEKARIIVKEKATQNYIQHPAD